MYGQAAAHGMPYAACLMPTLTHGAYALCVAICRLKERYVGTFAW
jgi:hypothetical protein